MESTMERIQPLVRQLAREVKEVLELYTEITRMDLTINIEGRVHGSDGLKITYGIGDYGPDVKGHDLRDVVHEWIRRKVWNERHQPLLLSATDHSEG